VPIAARVVGGALEAAARAEIQMPAQHLGAAGLDGAHDLELVAGQHVALSIRLPMRAEDVGDLEAGALEPRGRALPMTGQGTLRGRLASFASCRRGQSVERAAGLADVGDADLGVARRRADRSVAEQRLDGADVGTVLEQMGGEGVP